MRSGVPSSTFILVYPEASPALAKSSFVTSNLSYIDCPSTEGPPIQYTSIQDSRRQLYSKNQTNDLMVSTRKGTKLSIFSQK